jgi:hypothetical protein
LLMTDLGMVTIKLCCLFPLNSIIRCFSIRYFERNNIWWPNDWDPYWSIGLE